MTDLLSARPTRTSARPVETWPEGAVVVSGRSHARAALALNPTALALWELCDGQTAVAEMIDAVCVLFEVEPERARADVEAALTEMAAVGVIR
jgi:Coenzyme PQQ synthesis protein D (PqqD)